MSLLPEAMRTGDIKEEHIRLLGWVRNLLAAGHCQPDWTCHEVCEFVAKASQGKLVHYRGRLDSREHSWLMAANSNVLIDPYPCACGSGPLMVTLSGDSVWKFLYVGKPYDASQGE